MSRAMNWRTEERLSVLRKVADGTLTPQEGASQLKLTVHAVYHNLKALGWALPARVAKSVTDAWVDKVLQYRKTHTMRETVKKFGVSKNAIYRWSKLRA